ncbi:uncharacterized protein LOC135144468 isoform X2 [Zophobas morio]|uniref:uncharacterized protein LOC135144468 isoform X2 n=1 Tax=Zophobas morio TaxID=2755281 RepID=UPI003082D646
MIMENRASDDTPMELDISKEDYESWEKSKLFSNPRPKILSLDSEGSIINNDTQVLETRDRPSLLSKISSLNLGEPSKLNVNIDDSGKIVKNKGKAKILSIPFQSHTPSPSVSSKTISRLPLQSVNYLTPKPKRSPKIYRPSSCRTSIQFLPRNYYITQEFLKKRGAYSNSKTCNSSCNECHTSKNDSSVNFNLFRPYAPFLLLGYLQVLFSAFLIGLLIFLLVQLVLVIKSDIESKVQEQARIVMDEISDCLRHYRANRCNVEDRLPGLQQACTEWERCMNRDPGIVARGRVSFETLGSTINSFIEPLSYKSMFFGVLIVVGMVMTNFLLTFIRNSSKPLERSTALQNTQKDSADIIALNPVDSVNLQTVYNKN